MPIKLSNDIAISKTWEASGYFTPKMEFICGSCNRHNRKRRVFTDRNAIAIGPCDFCSETNVFQSGPKSNGNITLLTLQ